MNDKFLFDSIKEEFGNRELGKDKKPVFVNDNLNPKLLLRDYQNQAFNRFYAYYDNDNVEAYIKPEKNIHLAYHMATGSGKTVIMAGLILYLYKKGYRNFLFFVNRGQIVEKTKDNFINQQSSKYLFNNKIIIDDKLINIKAVDNFVYANNDDINICFTTIQGLFSDFHHEKENSLTIDDFKNNKITLIADEAHHINASTKTQQDWDKPSWENTVEEIFKSNDANILLEFSATIELDNKEVREKYLNKIIYQYDLRSFVRGGFSKKIDLLRSDTDKNTRILQALVISIYREQIAIKNHINIKPIVLCKSAKITDSKNNQTEFHQQIDNLKAENLQAIRDKTNIEVLQSAFLFFAKQDISLNALCEKMKHAFSSKKCLCTNSDKELEVYQKLLNNLEDKNNAIRIIFTVDKLNEGWDVLNLFDIIRLYEGQAKGGSNKGKVSKKTISEAQLIGRGARYCPFKIKDSNEVFQRKFDADITNELRVLEELYFHSGNESQYISELRQALTKEGLLDDSKQSFKLTLKDGIDLKNKIIFINKREQKDYNFVKNLADFGIAKCNFKYDIPSGKGNLTDAFQNTLNLEGGRRTKSINFVDFIGINIIKNALLVNRTFAFNNLKKYLPNLKSLTEFITDNNYLNQFEIDLTGNDKILTLQGKLTIALIFLAALEQELKEKNIKYQGSKSFTVKNAGDIFCEKTLLIAKEKINNTQRIDHKWFAFNEFYGSSEEIKLIELIEKMVDDIPQPFYLLRNERHFALYDFAQGRRFEPDFVLLSQSQGKNYQLFIEPKGKHLQPFDLWKEDFLLEIESKYKLSPLKFSNKDYKIIGLPFYNYDDENYFRDKLNIAVDITKKNNTDEASNV